MRLVLIAAVAVLFGAPPAEAANEIVICETFNRLVAENMGVPLGQVQASTGTAAYCDCLATAYPEALANDWSRRAFSGANNQGQQATADDERRGIAAMMASMVPMMCPN